MPKPLIQRFEEVDQTDLTDMLMIAARNVEDALIQSGATPGKDYNILDVYTLAQPFALELFRTNDQATFTVK
ncbi:hypothetical protein [Microbulbifer sp. PAAF003]|uniref:hypothetical protein n=1 Tax=unclassified Microbulbifer TaxID=2619833 RepID=UPI00403A6D9E